MPLCCRRRNHKSTDSARRCRFVCQVDSTTNSFLTFALANCKPAHTVIPPARPERQPHSSYWNSGEEQVGEAGNSARTPEFNDGSLPFCDFVCGGIYPDLRIAGNRVARRCILSDE